MPVFPDDVPELTDGRVTLRAHRESDLPRIVEFANDTRTRNVLSNLPYPYGTAQAREFFDKIRSMWESEDLQRPWAIEVDGTWAGTISLYGRAPGTAELGFGAHPEVRGRGVTTAAARLLVGYAFDTLHLRTVVWRAARGNWASLRIAWSLGFTYDGTWPGTHPDSNGRRNVTGTWFGHLNATDPRSPALPWHTPITLSGNGIRLRPWTPADAPSEPVDRPLARFMLGSAPDGDDFEEWLLSRGERMAGGEAVVWCIADESTDQALGGIQLFRMNIPQLRDTAMLAYWLQPGARGAGKVTAALDLVVAHAFSPVADGGLGLRRIGATVDVDNLASQRVLRTGGFRAIGTTSGLPAYDDGSVSDELEFELLATDDREAQRRQALPVPVLRTERLELRAWDAGDAPDEEPAPDPQAAAAMGIEPRPPAAAYDKWLLGERRDGLEGTSIEWCIADTTTGRPLGSIGVRGLGSPLRSGTIGYWLYDAARGHGVAKEALRAVVEYAFASDGLDLRRLDAATVDGNHSSMLTLAAAGFRQWGQDHGSFVAHDGTICDTAYFELLATEHQDAETP